MKILICPDSFKESIDAKSAAQAVGSGISPEESMAHPAPHLANLAEGLAKERFL